MATFVTGLKSTSGTQLLGDNSTPSVNPVGLDISRVQIMVLQLNVTASVGPTTLNVYLQSSVDGTNWDDFISFTQVGAVSTSRQIAQWDRDAVSASAVHAASDGALTAGTVINGPQGDQWRVKWTLVGTSYTFTLTGRQITRTR